VPETTASASLPTASASPSLTLLKRRARTLERWLVALLAVIVVAPPAVFYSLELVRARARAETQALQLAAMIGGQLRRSPADAEALGRALEAQARAGHLPGFIRVSDVDGRDLLRLGDRDPSNAAATVRRVLPASLAPLHEIEISVDQHPVLRDAARVLGIHMLVGLVLGFGFFRAPVRALHRAIREAETARAQLLHSDKLSAVGEAYASLTHEINNPLGIILSRVRLLRTQQRDRPLDPDVCRDLEVIERQGSRVAEIVRGMLAFTRKTDLRMKETDLNEIVREVTALVQKPFSKQEIRIETKLGESLPRIWGSAAHLQQVLLNLMNNARDAMPDGGTIVVRTAQKDGSVVAEVEDSGTGLAQEARGRVFEPFFTTKGKGTGLGLSVSYGIIQAHGGEIAEESETGKGALFRLTLPIEKRFPR
jgi:signal transduction histidine kinase